MSPLTRRIVQAVLYEAIALVFVGPVLAILFAQPVSSSLGLAAIMSAVALAWNYGFNFLFEHWEGKQAIKGRSFLRRLVHGICFEGALVIMLVPLMAYWLQTTLLQAFLADVGILVFFFIYAIGFTWFFDHLFGLPASARTQCDE